MNEAETRFTAYLDDHGYSWKHEPDYQLELGLPAPLATKPDFIITRNGERAVAEVRQFHTTHIRDRLAKSGGYGALSPQEVYGPLRSAIFEKAKQLQPLADLEIPLLVVFANPLNADVALDAHHVQAAMWGNPGYVVPINAATGGLAAGHDPYWRLEDYGVFASPDFNAGRIDGWENRHPHISAVVVVHERFHSADWREEIMRRHRPADDSFESASEAAANAIEEIDDAIAAGEQPAGVYRWVTVYETGEEAAVKVPVGWFGGPRDERYGHTEGGYGKLPAAG